MMGLEYQQNLFDATTPGYSVRAIQAKESYWLLLNVHYARRIPSISYAFGLFHERELVGVCTFGTPSSAALRSGIAGAEYADRVLELNRLCLVNNKPNEASRLVSAALNLLPHPAIVVSYADTEHGHEGIVYQATNFLYTGLSAKRTDWKVEGLEHLHGQTIADQVRGSEGKRVDAIKEKYGDKFYLKERSRKHRYIALLGHKWEKRNMLKALRYGVVPYPNK